MLLDERLEAFVVRLYADAPATWLTPDEYMALYTAAFEACVSRAHGGAPAAVVYDSLAALLRTRVLPDVRRRIRTPREYVAAFAVHAAAALHIEAVFQYVDRYWVPRAAEERRRDAPAHVYPMAMAAWDAAVLSGDVEALLLAHVSTRLADERAAEAHAMADEGENSTAPDSDVFAIVASYATLSCVSEKSMLFRATPQRARASCAPLMERLVPAYCADVCAAAEALSAAPLARTHAFLVHEERRATRYLSGHGGDSESVCRNALREVQRALRTAVCGPLAERLASELRALLLAGDESSLRSVGELLRMRSELVSSAAKEGVLPAAQTRLSACGGPEELHACWLALRSLVDGALGGLAPLHAAVDDALGAASRDMSVDGAAWASLVEDAVYGAGDAARARFSAFLIGALRGLGVESRQCVVDALRAVLARRLLAGTEAGCLEAAGVVASLAAEYGGGIAAPLRRMVADMAGAPAVSYGEAVRAVALAEGVWPCAGSEDCAIPGGLWPALDESLSSFGATLSAGPRPRRLRWSGLLTTCECAYVYGAADVVLRLTAVQAALVGALLSSAGLSFDALCASARVPAGAARASRGGLPKLVRCGMVAVRPGGVHVLEATWAPRWRALDLAQVYSLRRTDSASLAASSSADAPPRFASVPQPVYPEDRALVLQASVVRSAKAAHARGATLTVAELFLQHPGETRDTLVGALRAVAEREYVALSDEAVSDATAVRYVP